MLKLVHVINPVAAKHPSDLVTAQPITYQSMVTAKSLCDDVIQCAVFYPEDETVPIPGDFKRLTRLKRSVLDIGDFHIERKLPLFKDILNRVVDETNADYIIQTNCDIGLMPHFYQFVRLQIEKGYRAFIINKRIIPACYRYVSDLPEMYSELGTPHNGYDCFVFPKEDYKKYIIGNVCMGTPWSESTLAASMAKFSGCTVFKNAHVTFHIGDSRTWLNQNLSDYRVFNTNEFAKALKELSKDDPALLKHEVINWLLFKMKYELSQNHSKDCFELCEKTAGVR